MQQPFELGVGGVAKRILAFGQGDGPDDKSLFGQAGGQQLGALTAGFVAVQHQIHFFDVLVLQVLQQHRCQALHATQRQRILKTGLMHGQRIQHALHQKNAGASTRRHRFEKTVAVASAAAVRDFCAWRETAAVESGHAVVAVA